MSKLIKKLCPECASSWEHDAEYCGNCGTSLVIHAERGITLETAAYIFLAGGISGILFLCYIASSLGGA